MNDLGGLLVAVREGGRLVECAVEEVQGMGNGRSLVGAKMKGPVGVLNRKRSTWSSHREPRLKLSLECFGRAVEQLRCKSHPSCSRD